MNSIFLCAASLSKAHAHNLWQKFKSQLGLSKIVRMSKNLFFQLHHLCIWWNKCLIRRRTNLKLDSGPNCGHGQSPGVVVEESKNELNGKQPRVHFLLIDC